MTEETDKVPTEEELKMAMYMAPVEQAVRNVKTTEELLMIASVMAYKSRQIFDALIGEEQRKKIFRDIADDKL
jgi:DNA polymerase III sliding clamp (beta) subunit (PCNA family)